MEQALEGTCEELALTGAVEELAGTLGLSQLRPAGLSHPHLACETV